MLVSLQGGLIEINPFQVVTVRRSADGLSYTVQLTDNKEYVITAAEMTTLRSAAAIPVTLHVTAGP